MKKYSTGLMTVFALAGLLILGFASDASAQGAIQAGVEAARGSGVPTTLFGDSSIVTTITNTLLFIVGALAVIMIIFGGLRYATSGGDASKVTAAKNTILYAVVGLLIAFLAYAVVNWILGAMMGGGGVGGGGTNL